MVPARDTAAGVAAGAGTSGETIFRRGAGAGGAARVDPLLRRIKEAAAILLASVFHACRISLRLRISMHVELH